MENYPYELPSIDLNSAMHSTKALKEASVSPSYEHQKPEKYLAWKEMHTIMMKTQISGEL